RRILLSTDYLAQAVSTEIQRIFGCEIFDHYGMTEMGLGGGIECSVHQGCHLREADLYVEVIDPFSGKALPEGEYGEVVFTTLTRTGMPLIRYRTGDRSRWLAGNCPCGSVLPRLESIRMRQNGMILLGEADYLSLADLDEQLLALPGVIDFKAALTGLGRRPALTIEVMALGESLPCDEIEAALEKVDSVRRARQSNNLDLTINLLHCNADFIPGIGKRNISVI
ncbi:MAG TPA: phenylacetate--CoA ligase family protein, partial [Bacillota bacterium]|nr:phenylacetate--CoA ligase family protein [Bacillota bacterium]